MKKTFQIFSIAATLFLVALTATAQSTFSLGVKAGVNFSNFISKSNLEPGADAGVFFRIGKMVYFQPEVLYSFRTSSFETMVDEVKQNIEIQEHYIDIPLLLGVKVLNKDNFNLRVFLGPRVGLRLGSDYNDIDSMLGYAQWGGQAGIGIDFWRFTFDFKYDISVSKFKEFDNKTFWKQNIMSLAIGFKIIK